jgi:hypothetical protein
MPTPPGTAVVAAGVNPDVAINWPASRGAVTIGQDCPALITTASSVQVVLVLSLHGGQGRPPAGGLVGYGHGCLH